MKKWNWGFAARVIELETVTLLLQFCLLMICSFSPRFFLQDLKCWGSIQGLMMGLVQICCVVYNSNSELAEMWQKNHHFWVFCLRQFFQKSGWNIWGMSRGCKYSLISNGCCFIRERVQDWLRWNSYDTPQKQDIDPSIYIIFFLFSWTLLEPTLRYLFYSLILIRGRLVSKMHLIIVC